MTYESQAEDELQITDAAGILRWRCPNCGQTIFASPDETLPDVCHYCQDMTTWEPVDNPASILRWRCSHCGQILFTSLDGKLPRICRCCKNVTTWEHIGAANSKA